LSIFSQTTHRTDSEVSGLLKVLMKIQFLSNLTPCRMLNYYWRFEGSYCHHLHGQAVPEE